MSSFHRMSTLRPHQLSTRYHNSLPHYHHYIPLLWSSSWSCRQKIWVFFQPTPTLLCRSIRNWNFAEKCLSVQVIFVWLRSVSLPMEACVCIIGIKMQKITVIQDKVIITLTMLIEWRWVKTYVDCISALVIASDHAALSFRVEVTFHKVTSPALQKIHLYFFSRQQYNLIIYHL